MKEDLSGAVIRCCAPHKTAAETRWWARPTKQSKPPPARRPDPFPLSICPPPPCSPVGPEAHLLHHVLERDQITDVYRHRVAERLGGGVEVDAVDWPPDRLAVVPELLAVRRLLVCFVCFRVVFVPLFMAVSWGA